MDSNLKDIKKQLHEREKELDALYKLSELFTEPESGSDEIMRQTAEILKNAMQFEECAGVSIFLSDVDGTSKGGSEHGVDDRICCASAGFSIDKLVTIEVVYSCDRDFLAREKHLIKSTVELLANVLQKNELEHVLRQSTVRLQQQTEDLEHKNIALQEVLSHYDAEKKKYRAELDTFFGSIIYPELNKLLLDESLSEHNRDTVFNIRTSLENKFEKNLDSLLRIQHMLTPRELEICSMIKNGMSTKGISSHLNISELTVERHRNTIRKKLKLNNSSTNLTTFLRMKS